MPFRLQYSFSWVFFVGSLLLAAIQVQAEPLALTGAQRAMIAIGQALCTGVLPFLPKIQNPPSDSRVGMD